MMKKCASRAYSFYLVASGDIIASMEWILISLS